MNLQHRDGSEVKTGDIVWLGNQSCVFLKSADPYIEVQTTCDRRLFIWDHPSKFNLLSEANNE